jgi:hypothetical protein
VTPPHYRSYLIRIRRRAAQEDPGEGVGGAGSGAAHPNVRADVEDLLGGARGRVDGESARLLAAGLEALVHADEGRDVVAPASEPAIGSVDVDQAGPGASR